MVLWIKVKQSCNVLNTVSNTFVRTVTSEVNSHHICVDCGRQFIDVETAPQKYCASLEMLRYKGSAVTQLSQILRCPQSLIIHSAIVQRLISFLNPTSKVFIICLW